MTDKLEVRMGNIIAEEMEDKKRKEMADEMEEKMGEQIGR